jgi:hypothetical protein
MIDVIITGLSPEGAGRRPVIGFYRKNVETGSTERSMLRCRFTAACRKNGKPGLPRVRNIEAILQQHIEKVSFTGCSKMPGCKAPEIMSREAYFMVR